MSTHTYMYIFIYFPFFFLLFLQTKLWFLLNCTIQANSKSKDLQLKRAAETITKLKTQLQDTQLNLQVKIRCTVMLYNLLLCAL